MISTLRRASYPYGIARGSVIPLGFPSGIRGMGSPGLPELNLNQVWSDRYSGSKRGGI